MKVSQQTITDTPSRDCPQLFLDVLHRDLNGDRIVGIDRLLPEGDRVQGGEPTGGAGDIEVAVHGLAAMGLDVDEGWSLRTGLSLMFPGRDRDCESRQENVAEGGMKG